MISTKIKATFLNYASDILGNTNYGLSGSEIISLLSEYSVNFDVDIPHTSQAALSSLPNKRTALLENLQVFTSKQQYQIILELCEYHKFEKSMPVEIKELKMKLIAQYGSEFGAETEKDIDPSLIEETKHWLSNYKNSYTHYTSALFKYKNKIFERNALDDLRLSLELLLKELFQNQVSLENQVKNIGELVKTKGGTKEFRNMFFKLLEYYTKYQNNFVKHNDAVNEDEVEFIFEISSSFMKHIIKINNK